MKTDYIWFRSRAYTVQKRRIHSIEKANIWFWESIGIVSENRIYYRHKQ
ncbi:MAG: hypothetical protein Q3992_04060 [Bacteroides sp.]|nr:hypothetical protein [Bacteroides sp.]